MEKKKIFLSEEEAVNLLPHREKMALAKDVLECIPGKYIMSKYVTTGDEWYYQGCFTDKPVMPHLILIEILVQGGAIMMLAHEQFKGRLPVLLGLSEVKFGADIHPGDVMRLEGHLLKLRGNIGIGNAYAYLDGELAASCVIKFALVDWAEIENL